VTTILFADLVASTARIQALGDERAQRRFGALHERMTRALEAHGGEELQWLGDGLMAAFGSAADAVRAAIALQRVVRLGVAGERPGLRVGLNVGEALRQETGGGYFGTPVIVASRLCDRAGAGEILASSVVAGLLAGRRAFRFRELGPVALQGVEAPVAVCAVEYEVEAGTASFAGGIPFVGRAGELARLDAALECAEAGEGAVVFVTGEPGIGKTRLVAEFVALARQRGARVLAGRCFEGEGARPYAPFAEALDSYVGDADRAELLADLGPYGSQLGVLAPRLRARLSELPELPRLGGDEERTRLFYAISEFLQATAKRAPVVLALDDLHWADGATVALLRYLGRLVPKARLLLLGCYRDAEVAREHPLAIALASMKREVEYQRVALAGLEPESVGSLLEALAEHEVGVPFAEFMTVETAGNPFFLRELLVHLVEAGKLQREEGTWTATPSLGELGVPEGVRQVVGRRLARLSSAANRLLAAAAAFQGAFSFEVARRAVDLAEGEALDALDEALDAQLARPAGGAGDRYEFSHDLIRHTLDALPSPSRRARVHRRLAEEMERTWGEAPGERAAEIAWQYYQSRGLPGAERGAAHALASAELAERAVAQEQVASALRIALDLLPGTDARRPRLLARLALALAWSFAAEEATRIASEAADLLAATEGADVAADYLVELSRPVAVSSRPLAWRLAEQGLGHIGARRDLVWARLAWEDERRREHADPEYPGFSLDTPVRREITRVVLASGANALTLHRLGLDKQLALASREQALALGAPWTVAYQGGDLRRAVLLYLESLRLALRRGELSSASQDLAILSSLRSSLGELDAAEGCVAWATRLAARVSETSVLHINLVSARASIAWTRGEGFESLIRAGEAMLERAAPDQAFARAGLFSSLAVGYALIGRRAEARKAADRVLPAIERAPGWSAGYAGLLGDLVAASWWTATPVAGELLERNLRQKVLAPDFRAPGADARLSLARLCALDGRFHEAIAWFTKARDVLDEQGERPLRAIVDYDEALMFVRRGEHGDREQAAPLLEQALAQFDAIGMTGWERRARALLAPGS
jgi:class 3 adenylate cyclase